MIVDLGVCISILIITNTVIILLILAFYDLCAVAISDNRKLLEALQKEVDLQLAKKEDGSDERN